MGRRARSALLVGAVFGAVLAQVPAQTKELPPQYGRGLTVPVGFAASLYVEAPIITTTLTFGPDTGAAAAFSGRHSQFHGTLLYAAGVEGNPLNAISCTGCGRVVAFTDERYLVTPNDQPYVATGLNSVLGIAFRGSTMWVTDNMNSRGRVLALTDGNGDGFFETHRVVLKNIPNGRHQTNGLAVGPDGMMYVANGNGTDDGIECGPALPPENSEECPPGHVELKPWTGSIIRVDPDWTNVDLLADVRVDDNPFYAADGMDDESVLVSPGYRNIYDVDFNPRIPDEIWTPMNGPDNPSGSEPIFALDVNNEEVVGFDPDGNPIHGPVIEDAGFPSCVYDPHNNEFPKPEPYIPIVGGGHDHPGDPQPQQTLNDEVVKEFGPCKKDEVIRPRTVLKEGHEGTSGLAFERGADFPARYDGDLFVAEWGSLWNLNAVNPTGHKIIHLDVAPDGSISGRQREFMTGILPMDLVFGTNGHMFVADMHGSIYEVEHVTDAATETAVIQMLDPTGSAPQFVPQVRTVVRGQTVVWSNRTTVARDVTGDLAMYLTEDLAPDTEPDQINSPAGIPPNGTHAYTFDDPGVYHYCSGGVGIQCPETSTMRGTIIVLPVER